MEPVTNIGTIAPKEKIRKPLQILQPAATDKETLVGSDRIFRPVQQSKKNTKSEDVAKSKRSALKHKKVTSEDKAIQTAREEKIIIEAEDLTSANPSENYWQVLAEKRRMALVNTLEENKTLSQRIEKLKEDNHIYREMLEEAKTLIEVLQEEIENNRSDMNNSSDNSVFFNLS
ncbi:geminin-like [Nylanderia fulva]|uniref:geminin-like n=1 Tax=Nylanderia fulva TaxID=613905 RepID=UPI0010FAFA31|nr:geminin-like [Nylanderia fulva]